MWISNDLILKNKKEHKKEKEKALKKKAQEPKMEILGSIHEGQEEEGGAAAAPPPEEVKKAPKLSMEERVRQANVEHSKHLREQPIKRRHTIRSVKRDVSGRHDKVGERSLGKPKE